MGRHWRGDGGYGRLLATRFGCAAAEYLGRTRAPQLINVLPEVVVHDGADYLAVLSQPGMTFMTRDVPGRNAMSVEERIELYKREELTHDWYERTVGRSRC